MIKWEITTVRPYFESQDLISIRNLKIYLLQIIYAQISGEFILWTL